jgi:hypothetical protein
VETCRDGSAKRGRKRMDMGTMQTHFAASVGSEEDLGNVYEGGAGA